MGGGGGVDVWGGEAGLAHAESLRAFNGHRTRSNHSRFGVCRLSSLSLSLYISLSLSQDSDLSSSRPSQPEPDAKKVARGLPSALITAVEAPPVSRLPDETVAGNANVFVSAAT